MSLLRTDRRFPAVAALVVVAATAWGAPVPAPRPVKPSVDLNSATISRLVGDLQSRDFASRRRATQLLARGDRRVVAPLLAAALAGDAETIARATDVLSQIYIRRDEDDPAVIAAEDALEKLAVSSNPIASVRAAALLNGPHSELRERRAIAVIEKLGGIVTYLDTAYAARPNALPGELRTVRHVLIGRKWTGGDKGLKHIRRVSSLQRLYVARSAKFKPVTRKALDDLQLAMPGLDVQMRGTACLGVGGRTNSFPAGCYISEVKPGSAAANGGVNTGDVIVGFGGKRVSDFQAMIDLIAQKDPGDKVPVQVYRFGRTLTLEVTLAEWSQ